MRSGRSPRATPEHRPGGQPASSRVVVVEKAADELSGGVQTLHRPARSVQHPGGLVYAHSTEGEGDAARNREPVEGWRVERLGPVGLGRLDAFRTLAVR